MNKTETIITDIYDAWRAQDLDWLASYLPDEFHHIMYIPSDIYSGAGSCRGKAKVIERWRLVVAEYEFLEIETGELIVVKDRAAIEIPFRYRHRGTGKLLETVKANFWTLEDGWPIRLTEYYDVDGIRSFTASLAAQLKM
jgi:ketosteroid isomerase-like protein